VRRSHGCVDVVFHAGLARQRRKTHISGNYSVPAEL
jgi:hypothetical protein